MRIKVQNIPVDKINCDLLVVNLFEGVKELAGATAAIDRKLKGAITALIKKGQITGKLGEINFIPSEVKLSAAQIVVVGLGKEAEFDLDRLRKVAAAALAAAKRAKAKIVATIVHGAGAGGLKLPEAAQALTEGSLLGTYHYQGYATGKDESFKIEELIVVEISKPRIKELLAGVRLGTIISEAANNARDLVNGPSNKVTPAQLAAEAKKVSGVRVSVLSLAQAKKLGMESFYAVAKAAKEPAKFIIMQYGKGKPEVALIGKGITFDAGGISLKPSRKLWEMKTDMAGAAAVLETMRVIARLGIRKNVVALLPCTENMPDGQALKPGDVIGSLLGKTIEIISTDAEGRLILADAIGYARKILKVNKIIDVATLTGACSVSLGDVASGIMGNDQTLVDRLVAAGKQAGEKLWQLPLYEEYQDYSKSSVADIKNCTELGKAGTAIGGLFLQLFAEGATWAHIDIAGTAYLDKKQGYLSPGATGVMVRTLTEYLRS